MRKTISPVAAPEIADQAEWLSPDEIASVEVTSEDSNCPVERAFECREASGWRAASPGEQRIRIAFASPRSVRRIRLRFVETAVERSQEFDLYWWDAGGARRFIRRQQWNFSPAGSTVELEDYRVDLAGVSQMELTIRPGSQADHVASLDCWRMA